MLSLIFTSSTFLLENRLGPTLKVPYSPFHNILVQVTDIGLILKLMQPCFWHTPTQEYKEKDEVFLLAILSLHGVNSKHPLNCQSSFQRQVSELF